jgi:hypothetical protein
MALAFSYHRGGLNEVEIWRLLTLATKINARELDGLDAKNAKALKLVQLARPYVNLDHRCNHQASTCT